MVYAPPKVPDSCSIQRVLCLLAGLSILSRSFEARLIHSEATRASCWDVDARLGLLLMDMVSQV